MKSHVRKFDPHFQSHPDAFRELTRRIELNNLSAFPAAKSPARLTLPHTASFRCRKKKPRRNCRGSHFYVVGIWVRSICVSDSTELAQTPSNTNVPRVTAFVFPAPSEGTVMGALS